MKTHKTIMLTEDTLLALYACASGLDAAMPFLPAKISTDPEDNLELADAFVTAVDAEYDLTAHGLAWAQWLVESATTDAVRRLWDGLSISGPTVSYLDTRYLVAQMLAIWADAALTAKGK